MVECNRLSQDRLERLDESSLIQHGPYNDRIYLMKVAVPVPETLPAELVQKARQLGYSKIFAKVPAAVESLFAASGYLREAVVPGLFNRQEDGVFLGRLLTEGRQMEADPVALDGIVSWAETQSHAAWPLSPDSRFQLRECTEPDAQALAEIYRRVFPAYPFPIQDPAYLRQTMRGNIVYFGVEVNGKLVAASSAEYDHESSSAEMSDFATLPEWRGNRLASALLVRMEQSMKQHDIQTGYTIARAVSRGMNLTFARGGYRFAGRLINNTRISEGIESMNVWYKPIR